METKIKATNDGGRVLAIDSEEITGQLDFTFSGNILSIDHTRAFKEGIGVASLLVQTVTDYAIDHKLKVDPVCAYAKTWYDRHPQFCDILYMN